MPLLQRALAKAVLVRVPEIEDHVDGSEAVAGFPVVRLAVDEGLQLLDGRPVPLLLAVDVGEAFADDRVGGVEFGGPFEFLQGLVVAALLEVGGAEVHVDGGLVGVEADALLVGGDGPVHFALGVVDGPEVRPGEGVLRVEFGGQLAVGLGLVEVAQAEVDHPQVHAGGDVVGVQADHVLVGAGRLGVAFQGLVHAAKAVVEGVLGGFLVDGAAIGVDGLLELALLAPGVAQAHVRQGEVGVEFDRALELLDGLVQPAGLQMDVSGAVAVQGLLAVAPRRQAADAGPQDDQRDDAFHEREPPMQALQEAGFYRPRTRLSKQSRRARGRGSGPDAAGGPVSCTPGGMVILRRR